MSTTTALLQDVTSVDELLNVAIASCPLWLNSPKILAECLAKALGEDTDKNEEEEDPIVLGFFR